MSKDMFSKLGDWAPAGKALSAGFNFSSSTVKRWTRAAQGLDAEVLAELARPELEAVPGAAMWDNEWLMGSGPKARSKLTPSYAKFALQSLREREKLSAAAFAENVCAPLKVLESGTSSC